MLAERVSTVTAYQQQSGGYDAEAGGGLFAGDEPVMAEYPPTSSRYWPNSPACCARGDLVISDIHHELVSRGSVITARGPQGEPCIAATYRHKLGDYLRPALSLGLRVRRCEEPAATGTGGTLPVPATEIGDWWHWPWSLMNYLPSAARAAGGRPSLVIWHFQLPAA